MTFTLTFLVIVGEEMTRDRILSLVFEKDP